MSEGPPRIVEGSKVYGRRVVVGLETEGRFEQESSRLLLVNKGYL